MTDLSRRLFLGGDAALTAGRAFEQRRLARMPANPLVRQRDADIMDPASWSKSSVPVFASSPANRIWGPWHNSFAVDERGRDMLVYHARDDEKIVGDPLFDPNRHTRMQPIRYRADGTPDFGVPVRSGPASNGPIVV